MKDLSLWTRIISFWVQVRDPKAIEKAMKTTEDQVKKAMQKRIPEKGLFDDIMQLSAEDDDDAY